MIDLAGNFITVAAGGKVVAMQLFGGGSAFPGMAMMILFVAVFYFLLILPQQNKQKKWQALLGQLKTGDKIVTTGGLRGTIISLKDDAIILRVPPDGVKLEVSRGSVVTVTTAEEEKEKKAS